MTSLWNGRGGLPWQSDTDPAWAFRESTETRAKAATYEPWVADSSEIARLEKCYRNRQKYGQYWGTRSRCRGCGKMKQVHTLTADRRLCPNCQPGNRRKTEQAA
jgi:hypothetical protein